VKRSMFAMVLASFVLSPLTLQAQSRSNTPDRRGMSQPEWTEHVRACKARYRSYDEKSDTYAPRAGVRERCTLGGGSQANPGNGHARASQGPSSRTSANADRQGMSQSQWAAHVRACKARYKSYNEQTDRYVPRVGTTAHCTLQ